MSRRLAGIWMVIGLRVGSLLMGIGLAEPISPVVAAADVDRLSVDRLEDAELTATMFLDAEHGWAVGDRGVIWQTTDGGRTWRLRPSPSDCRWEDIVFVDQRNGWIAGGLIEPGTHKTKAVLLRTRDGGQNWMQFPLPTLPGLRRIAFQDERRGWAVGTASAMYPTGIFETQDGGRSWSPLPGQTGEAWLTGDFRRKPSPANQRRSRLGIAAGASGNLALILPDELVETRLPATPVRAVRQIRINEAGDGWLVGDGGLILQTSDGGLQWRPPAGSLPTWLSRCDLTALAVQGSRCWIGGAPGSWILSSADRGATWDVQSTGQTLPLKQLQFVDDQHGWSVGALGTILATRDGGRTWRRQHGGQRLAILAIVERPQQVPFELLAQLCGNDGYRGGVVIPFRRDLESGETCESPAELRLQSAVIAAGGSAAVLASHFPVRQRGLGLSVEQQVTEWHAFHSLPPEQALEEYLAAQIRQWRPDVVVTDDPEASDDGPLAQYLQRAVLAATTRAASTASDDRVAPGLDSWQVKKVFSALPGSDRGTIRIASNTLAPRLGHTLADAVTTSYELVDKTSAPEAQSSYRLLASHQSHDSGRRDIFGGITLPAGSEARRAAPGLGKADLAALQRTAQQQRNIQQLLLRGGDTARGASWQVQFDDLTRHLRNEDACQVAWQLVRRFQQAGQHELAAATCGLIFERYQQQMWCDAALVELVRYHTSGELAYWRQREAGSSSSAANVSPAGRLDPRDSSATVSSPLASSGRTTGWPVFVELPVPAPIRRPSRVATAAALSSSEDDAPITPTAQGRITATDVLATERVGNDVLVDAPDAKTLVELAEQKRQKSIAALAEWLERNRPWLFAEPGIKAALAGATARQGRANDVRQWWRTLGSSSRSEGWAQVARQELSRLDQDPRTATPPAATRSPNSGSLRCAEADKPPQLDGKLDEPFWEGAQAAALRSQLSDDQDWPAVVLFAHDAEHLYLAIHCRKATGVDYSATPGPRPRDPNLAGRDRVELCLDIDRDYQTAYELVVDSRGWVGERCAGDARWNPSWFVAARDDAAYWTVEAAIPWRELSPQPPENKDAWSLGIQRIVPGVGFQSWTKPATVAGRSDGWGLMVFE